MRSRRPKPARPAGLRRRLPGPLLGATLCCALLPAACGGGTAGNPRASVLVITLDTTRADHLGCYGYRLDTSPRLDRLAREGTRFTRCIASSALTPVSHASILSGLDPDQHGLRVLHAASGWRLPETVPTLATIAGAAGWSTAAVLSAFPVSEHFGFERGFEHFDNGMAPDLQLSPEELRRDPDRPRHPRQRRSDATTDAAIAWLSRGERPFFLWVHYWDPHDPILVPPDEAIGAFRRASAPAGGDPPDLYDTEIRFMDAQIGRLLDALEAQGLDRTTLVIVTADHGEGQGEHDWHSHRLLYQEQIHVPLIVRLPGRGAGRMVDELVRTIDVFPTVLEVLGLAPARPVAGRSLLELLDGHPEPARLAYAEALIKWDTRAELIRDTRAQDDDLLHCLTDGRTKLIYRPLGPERSELYDLALDPLELDNLYGTGLPVQDALVDELLRRNPFALEPLGGAELDPDAAEALRALGYGGDG